MTKHYDTDAACFIPERLTIRQESAIDLDFAVINWLAYIVPGAVAGSIVAYVLLSVVACVKF
jgi:hypothetical protein